MRVEDTANRSDGGGCPRNVENVDAGADGALLIHHNWFALDALHVDIWAAAKVGEGRAISFDMARGTAVENVAMRA